MRGTQPRFLADQSITSAISCCSSTTHTTETKMASTTKRVLAHLPCAKGFKGFVHIISSTFFHFIFTTG